jgi:hypothetical protein
MPRLRRLTRLEKGRHKNNRRPGGMGMLEAKRPHQQWKQKQPQKHKVERPRQQESQHRRGRSQQRRTRRSGLVKRAMKAGEVNSVAKVKVLLMGTVLRRLKEVPKL